MTLNCSGAQTDYDELYKGLEETQYGEQMKTKAAICHDNVLYYYGVCEKVNPNVTERSEMSIDCIMANMYLEQQDMSLLSYTPKNRL